MMMIDDDWWLIDNDDFDDDDWWWWCHCSDGCDCDDEVLCRSIIKTLMMMLYGLQVCIYVFIDDEKYDDDR